jgi:hypothetical protein
MTNQEIRNQDHSCTEPLDGNQGVRTKGVDRPCKSCLCDWGRTNGGGGVLPGPEEKPLRVGRMTAARLSEGFRLLSAAAE